MEWELGCARWETLLARELRIANDEAHRAAKAYNRRHHRADATVAYDAQRVHFNIQDSASVIRNWEIARVCLDSIRRYYLVLPQKQCLPSGFNGIKERHIELYMREWDQAIALKEFAEAQASDARTANLNAVARTQHRENDRARKRVREQRGLSLDPSDQ